MESEASEGSVEYVDDRRRIETSEISTYGKFVRYSNECQGSLPTAGTATISTALAPLPSHQVTPAMFVRFQNGPISETGVNGVQVEDVLNVALQRTEFLNRYFPCVENNRTIKAIEEAVQAQQDRTNRRTAAGSEGTNLPDDMGVPDGNFTSTEIATALATPLPHTANYFGGEVQTLRGYLVHLLVTLWAEGEGFSGKRPFGDSGWQWDVQNDLEEAGVVPDDCDAEQLVESCIDSLF